MKKLLQVLLAVCLCLVTGCSSDSSTSDDTTTEQTDGKENLGNFFVVEEDGIIDAAEFGMKITIPEDLRSDEYKWALNYVTMVDQAQAVLMLVDNDGNDIQHYLATFIGIREHADPEDFLTQDSILTADMIHELGTNETFYYYGILTADEYEVDQEYIEDNYMDDMSDDQKEAYLDLMDKTYEIFENIEFTDLVLPDSVDASDVQSQQLMDMVVKDFDQNEVRLGDLIAENEVTMINVWGTFCGACVSEMPILEILSHKFEDHGFGIVGICTDVVDEDGSLIQDKYEDGLDIIEDTGVTYPCVYVGNEIYDIYEFTAFPTTFFVDSNGKMLMDPVFGSNTESGWTKIIEEALLQ